MNDQRLDEEPLTSSLQLLAEDLASQNAPPEIEQRLRKAFRAHAAATAASKRYARYWLAAAAVLLIVITVIALRSRIDKSSEIAVDQPKPAPVKETPSPVDNQVYEAPRKVEIAQKPRRRSVRRPANNEVANHVGREIATDFMPLGYLNPTAFQDGGQIIRVELPRSALVNFGLPVNMDRYNERVKADVLLGVDGLARAIRFVQ